MKDLPKLWRLHSKQLPTWLKRVEKYSIVRQSEYAEAIDEMMAWSLRGLRTSDRGDAVVKRKIARKRGGEKVVVWCWVEGWYSYGNR